MIQLVGIVCLCLTASEGLPDPGAVDSHRAYVARVDAARDESLRATLAVYDAHLELRPQDVLAAIERCKLIGALMGEDEPNAKLETLYSECPKRLTEQFSREPAALLYELETMWGQSALSLGAKLLADGIVASKSERARVYQKLAEVQSSMGQVVEAGDAAERAMSLDPNLDLTQIAAAKHLHQKRRSEAVTLLLSHADVGSPWQRAMKAKSLVDAGAFVEATTLLERIRASNPDFEGDPLLYASALEGAGRTGDARKAYAAATGEWNKKQVLLRLFALDLRRDDAESAVRSYQALRDLGWSADPLARHRLALTWHFPTSPWAARDLLGVVALIGCIAVLALAPLLWVVPVHYLSLLRDERRRRAPPSWMSEPSIPSGPSAPSEPASWSATKSAELESASGPRTDTESGAPESPWGARTVWLASAVVLLGQTLGAYVFAYTEAQKSFDAHLHLPPVDQGSLAAYGFMSVLASILTIPLLLRRGQWRAVFGAGRWSVWQSVVAAGRSYVLVLAIGSAYMVFGKVTGIMPSSGANALTGGELTSKAIIAAIAQTYGTGVMMMVVALIVPIGEEFVFRSVILGAYSRWIPFRWANVLQALLFTLVHDSPASMPVIFSIGLLAGRLRRRSGGLLASILMHAVNNAGAALVLTRGGPI